MSTDTLSPAPPTDPDPPRAAPAMPAALGRVLSLVRKLIDYGKQLAGTVQQRAAVPGFALFASPFGTTDLAVILARITSGLRRAAALEVRLCRCAARGQDLRRRRSACPSQAGRAPCGRSRRPTPSQRGGPHQRPTSRAPPHGRANRRRGAPPPWAPSSSISAETSASRPAISTGRSGTRSATPSLCMAAASPASSQPAQAAVRLFLRRAFRPCGPRMARGTAASGGTRHRPAVNKEFQRKYKQMYADPRR